MAMTQVHPLAKLAKDIGAGAVLVFNIITIIVVLIIMIPRIF
jgi:undecaprenol kinase